MASATKNLIQDLTNAYDKSSVSKLEYSIITTDSKEKAHNVQRVAHVPLNSRSYSGNWSGLRFFLIFTEYLF